MRDERGVEKAACRPTTYYRVLRTEVHDGDPAHALRVGALWCVLAAERIAVRMLCEEVGGVEASEVVRSWRP